MKYDMRRAARQYLVLLALMLCSLLLVTCLSIDEDNDTIRDYNINRSTHPTTDANSTGRAE
jgi:hypothetical protein